MAMGNLILRINRHLANVSIVDRYILLTCVRCWLASSILPSDVLKVKIRNQEEGNYDSQSP
jgi:hypothetical protein